MHTVTRHRLRVALDMLDRALKGLTHQHLKSLAAYREDVERIINLDEDERPTQPNIAPALPQAETGRSGVRGLWEREDEAKTPVMRRRAR